MLNKFGYNHYIIQVGDDVYELSGYSHDLGEFIYQLQQEMGYSFYQTEVKVYTL